VILSTAAPMIELNGPSTQYDWIILMLIFAVVYLVFRK
jgi:hypothetical protein